MGNVIVIMFMFGKTVSRVGRAHSIIIQRGEIREKSRIISRLEVGTKSYEVIVCRGLKILE